MLIIFSAGSPPAQVYRYMYNDIIRIADFGRLFSLADIQAYKANGHPAVHLRPRDLPKTKSPAGFTGKCGGCGRCLSSDWTYCSLYCRLGLEWDPAMGGTGAGASLSPGAETRTASVSREPRAAKATWSDDEFDTAERTASATGTAALRNKRRAPVGTLKGAKRRKPECPARSSLF